MQQNQRRFPRLSMVVKTEYRVMEDSLPVQSTKTRDISIAGLCIGTDRLLDKDKYVDIVFYLPREKEPVKAIGKVVWSQEVKPGKFESGIEFVKIEFADQERIGKFMTDQK